MSASVACAIFCDWSIMVLRSPYDFPNALIDIMAMLAAVSKLTALAFINWTIVGMA